MRRFAEHICCCCSFVFSIAKRKNYIFYAHIRMFNRNIIPKTLSAPPMPSSQHKPIKNTRKTINKFKIRGT